MSRVLLVCPEPLGHGHPAGVGVRFTEIARVLLADGHDVVVLSPDAGKIDGCGADFISNESFAAHSVESDVAVVQGHVANAFFLHAKPIPTVIDLYDPFIIENMNYWAERGAEVFQYDHLTLMGSLVRGDFFLCASEAQRLFYLGLLVATGRLNPMLFERDPRLESLIRLAPFGVQAPRPLAPQHSHDILFGGVYDWYDPVRAIDVVKLVREEIPDATLTFTRHPNPDITPQGKLAEAMQHAKKHRYDFVRFEPWAAYEQRAEYFERFALALLTFPRSLETDLAMRTRIYDYLWCGLPIVTSSAPGTDELLVRYDAGTVIHDDAPGSFAREIVAILRDRARYDRMRDGAQQFVRAHQWDRTLAPLREFCRHPGFEKTKELFATQPAIHERPPSILDRLKRRLRA
ncbi:MAG TPA: glycosyltransferase family 4 protein [Thermoanaerobaculia bacterium]|nr:glycosyltransferase family 4 protein [Thermoanaerobaculia bacterium]